MGLPQQSLHRLKVLLTVGAKRIEYGRRIFRCPDATGLFAIQSPQWVAIDAPPTIVAQRLFVLLQKCQKLFAILWPALRVSQRIDLQRRLGPSHRAEKVTEQEQDFRVDQRIAAP